MKKKNYFITITLLLFIIGQIYFYCIQNKFPKGKFSELSIFYKEMLIRQSFYGGDLNIQPEMAIIDKDGNNIKLPLVVNGEPKLVFRFTDL